MRSQIRIAILAITVAAACPNSVNALAENSAAAVRVAATELENWLGRGANGKSWEAYLKLHALEEQLDKGIDADEAVLAQVLKQLDSGAPGLALGPFAKLRTAISNWNDELKIARAPDLAQSALGAEADFRAVTDDDVARSKVAFQTAAKKLDRYLTVGGANGTAWKKYLAWDDLQAQLKIEKPDVEILRSVYQRFVADQPGLELDVFMDTASALERYINDLAARNGDVKAQYGENVKALADEIKRYSSGYPAELASAVGERLAWLDNMRQAGALVRAIRGRLSRPNLHARLSERLIAAGIEQDVNEQTPVRDVILGTDISGTGHLVGKLTAQLIANQDNAVLETLLNGTVTSRTVGYNGPAVIHSNGSTAISGRKRIVFSEKGLASYPATATANTKTQIAGIAAGSGGIVQRVATRKVYESKSQAEQIGSAHAAARVRKRVDAQADAQLGKAHWNYVNKVRNPLLRRREFPQLMHLSTTDDALFLVALQADSVQLAAPDNPPSINVDNDIAIQLHESAVNNLASALLAGVTLKEADVQKQAIDLLGKLPEQLKTEEDRDPWSITFAKVRPVTMRFADNGFQVTIRGQRYTSGDRDFQAMNVTADYKIESDGAKFRLVRKEDLLIEPPNFVKGKTLSGRQIALKTLLEKRFGKLFDKEIASKGLVLPGKWRAAGRLDPKQLQANAGWLVVAWIESGEPAPPEDKVAQNAP